MLTRNFISELSAKFQTRAKFDEPLAPHVAYRVGGPADVLVFPHSEEELWWLAESARREAISITVIGTGTNLLVRDEGIRGIVVSLKEAFNEITVVPNGDAKILVRCGGGVEKPMLLEWAIRSGYAGLEFSAGVPGTIGGGIYMNAGTKYGSYGDLLVKLRLFDMVTGGIELAIDRQAFGYRQQTVVNESIVLWALFELRPGDRSAMRTEVDRIIAERAEKQPLDLPSCGSTFKNPEGYSAGRLIEKAGLKGLRVGGAEISTKHANFILNRGSATASDILSLIATIKDSVRTKFSIELECEVVVLGGNRGQKQVPH